MRLPLSKVWRAFPQLDRFSDDECRRFVQRAEQENSNSRLLFAAACGAVTILALPFFFWFGHAVVEPVAKRIAMRLSGPAAANFDTFMQVLDFAGPVLVLSLAYFIARDWWLIRTITRKVQVAACPKCGYSLLGLVVAGGVVTCPECHHTVALSSAGLTEQDLEVG